jgi:hypothetical protein
MPTMTMTVKYVNPPKAGKQRGSIKGTDDQILGVFADKMHLFEPGSTYEIEYTETVSSGVTYRNVKSATAIAAPTTSSAPSPTAHNTYRETSANDAKRMFVCANLSALIRAGEVKNDKAHDSRRISQASDPCRLLPFSLGAANRAGRVDDSDFGWEVIR